MSYLDDIRSNEKRHRMVIASRRADDEIKYKVRVIAMLLDDLGRVCDEVERLTDDNARLRLERDDWERRAYQERRQ